MAGPTIRVALKAEEFSAIALVRSRSPTSSTKKLCRVGISKALAIPRTRRGEDPADRDQAGVREDRQRERLDERERLRGDQDRPLVHRSAITPA
jgi:hypothetical protein